MQLCYQTDIVFRWTSFCAKCVESSREIGVISNDLSTPCNFPQMEHVVLHDKLTEHEEKSKS